MRATAKKMVKNISKSWDDAKGKKCYCQFFCFCFSFYNHGKFSASLFYKRIELVFLLHCCVRSMKWQARQPQHVCVFLISKQFHKYKRPEKVPEEFFIILLIFYLIGTEIISHEWHCVVFNAQANYKAGDQTYKNLDNKLACLGETKSSIL